MNFLCFFFRNGFACACQNFTRQRRDDVFCQNSALDAVCNRKFFIVLIAAYSRHFVFLVVEEGVAKQCFRAVHSRDFARTQSLEQVEFTLLNASAISVLCYGVFNHIVAVEQVSEFFVGADTQSSEQSGSRNTSGSVNLDPRNVACVLFKFKPCATARNNLRSESGYAVLVFRFKSVNARASDNLADDNTFRAVDNERTRFRHKRKIAHKDFLLDNFTRFVVGKPCPDFKRNRIGCVTVFTLFNGVFRLAFEGVT